MAPEGDGTNQDEIRAISPEEMGSEHAEGVATAMTHVAKERRGQVDKDLRKLERVHAKYAKKAEQAAAKAGLDQASIKTELEALRGLPQEQAEERLAAMVERYRPLRGRMLKEAGVDADALAEEAMSTVELPKQAKAQGRRKTADTAGDGDDLGWTTQEEQS